MIPNEVFSINFIRREFVPLSIRRAVIYGAFVFLLINAAILLGMIVFAVQSHSELHAIQKILAREIPTKAAMADLRQDLSILETRAGTHTQQLDAVASFQKDRLWAGEKLDAIAETLPARTWVTQIAGAEAQKTFTIQAIYLIDPKKPYELPIKGWMEKLKGNPQFREGLSRFELTNSSRKLQGNAEVCDFQMIAEWNPKGK